MSTNPAYYEKISSKKTEFLFITLTLLFSFGFIWRVMVKNTDFLTWILIFISIIFLFYSVNYRNLIIRLTADSLILTFGIFTWTIPLNNIANIQSDDDLPVLMKYGGAGIHFMYFNKKYRASFNFLEHSRVVIELKKKAGLVKAFSFSTCQPDEIIKLVQKGIRIYNTSDIGKLEPDFL